MRTVLPGPCPVCNTEIEFLYQTENIPFFSDIVIISASCPDCGFRYVDTQVLTDRDPARWEFEVLGTEDLSVRVVRSMRAIVIIPELGVRIDPGPACEGFVTNVEGVIARVERVVDGVIACEAEEEKDSAAAFKERVASVRSGELPITLIIEDPSGNSAIVSERAIKTPFIPDAEAC
ncbi:MAG: ZPR1 zinc finger domain-containing protein [Methanoregulaceae archaeon]|nr:ZPR1 zinc finger domain-containing protein [Methanoregulaceae archaeon]